MAHEIDSILAGGGQATPLSPASSQLGPQTAALAGRLRAIETLQQEQAAQQIQTPQGGLSRQEALFSALAAIIPIGLGAAIGGERGALAGLAAGGEGQGKAITALLKTKGETRKESLKTEQEQARALAKQGDEARKLLFQREGTIEGRDFTAAQGKLTRDAADVRSKRQSAALGKGFSAITQSLKAQEEQKVAKVRELPVIVGDTQFIPLNVSPDRAKEISEVNQAYQELFDEVVFIRQEIVNSNALERALPTSVANRLIGSTETVRKKFRIILGEGKQQSDKDMKALMKVVTDPTSTVGAIIDVMGLAGASDKVQNLQDLLKRQFISHLKRSGHVQGLQKRTANRPGSVILFPDPNGAINPRTGKVKKFEAEVMGFDPIDNGPVIDRSTIRELE